MNFIDLSTQYQLIENKINQRIQDVLGHKKFIMGPEVQELEKSLAEFVGVEYAISCANGTDALSIALLALDIEPGDEIITTPFTFFATGETIALSGAKLVFVDIDPETYNIDTSKIEEKITPKTKIILPVSLYGQMSNMVEVMEIAKKHGLRVIEDAAQSFGAQIGDKKSCSFADISTTSFFPAKPLGCYGDGGALFTTDSELAQKIQEIRNHGQSKRYVHTRLGFNSRLDTLQAAILIEKLAIFPGEVSKRQEVATRYYEALAGKVKTATVLDGYKSAFAQFTIEVDNRAQFLENMKEQGIPTAVHYPIPIHEQPIFKDLGYKNVVAPLAKSASERVVSLPMHPYLTAVEQQKVVAAVEKSLN
ncbi:MAG: aminotransferase DegT [Halobacteriovoraceae bacterium]|nr:aminotransferase DegT [Halobacteriovoraceae bacterium]|tara:strand:+ start:30832 stop:31923 length:1092 start_codon:yes stop_codon:yes gene_type:complete